MIRHKDICLIPGQDLCLHQQKYPDRMGTGSRIEQRRTNLGFSQEEVASRVRRLGGEIHQTGIDKIEKRDTRRPRFLKEIAIALGVTEDWLLNGKEPMERFDASSISPKRTIQVVGYVGAGAEIFSIDDHAKGGGLDEVDTPYDGMSPSTVAVKVRGSSMEPAFYDGDLIFYDRQENGDLAHLLGRECVVALSDERKFIKILKRRQNGEWFLHSNNADPILDVSIAWAAKVKFIQRA